jgi:hypothetical protein
MQPTQSSTTSPSPLAETEAQIFSKEKIEPTADQINKANTWETAMNEGANLGKIHEVDQDPEFLSTLTSLEQYIDTNKNTESVSPTPETFAGAKNNDLGAITELGEYTSSELLKQQKSETPNEEKIAQLTEIKAVLERKRSEIARAAEVTKETVVTTISRETNAAEARAAVEDAFDNESQPSLEQNETPEKSAIDTADFQNRNPFNRSLVKLEQIYGGTDFDVDYDSLDHNQRVIVGAEMQKIVDAFAVDPVSVPTFDDAEKMIASAKLPAGEMNQ